MGVDYEEKKAMTIRPWVPSARQLPAKAQDLDNIFQFLFNLIDLFNSLVNLIGDILALQDAQEVA